MATITQATLKIYIWQGSEKAVPATPKYTLTKDRLSSSDPETNQSIITFEVSELIKDYINISFDGDYSSIVQNSWVKFTIDRVFDNNPLFKDTIDKDNVIAFTGYGEFQDGINPRLSNNYLISNDTVFVKRGERAFVPFFQSVEEDNAFIVEYLKAGTSVKTERIGGSVVNFRVDSTELKADTTLLKADATQARTADSTKFQLQSEIPSLSDEIKATLQNGQIIRKKVKYIDDCKNTSYKISFINKFGVIQDLWFFKRRDDSFEVNREGYKRSILDIGESSVSYNEYKASRQALDISGKEKLTMNTGYLTEDHNEVIKQLMVTEHCWVHQESGVTPVIPSTTSFQEKKEVNEKLLNFTVEFEVANNYIQDIR